jgi:hypothetical protein
MSKRKPFTHREQWLACVTEGLRPHFADRGFPITTTVRHAIGFPSTGRKGKRIGECWDSRASADGHFEIFLRPDLHDPLQIAATLAHELVHAAVGLAHGHDKVFGKLAREIGLEGKLTATYAGEAFKRLIAPLLKKAGTLPHGSLRCGGATITTAPKKQTTRMLKCACGECGYAVRIARKWLDDVGAPHCPEHGEMEVAA